MDNCSDTTVVFALDILEPNQQSGNGFEVATHIHVGYMWQIS